jgi:hypothetical protein
MGVKKYVSSLEYLRGERQIPVKRHKGGRLIKELRPTRLEVLKSKKNKNS